MPSTRGGHRNGRRRPATETQPFASWREPQPVPRGRPPVPSFDDALLPRALAPWVADVADRVQCPPDFVGAALPLSCPIRINAAIERPLDIYATEDC